MRESTLRRWRACLDQPTTEVIHEISRGISMKKNRHIQGDYAGPGLRLASKSVGQSAGARRHAESAFTIVTEAPLKCLGYFFFRRSAASMCAG
jgi:hypothetical protein